MPQYNFGFRLVDASIISQNGTVRITGPDGQVFSAPNRATFGFSDGTVENDDGNFLVDDLSYYSKYQDVWQAKVDADLHFTNSGRLEGRAPNAFWNPQVYLAHNPDVAASGMDPLMHYQVFGWREGRDPSAAFDTKLYLLANPDVAKAGIDPLDHFLYFGQHEGRIGDLKPVYQVLVDQDFYLAQNPDVAASSYTALEHWVSFGRFEGRAANAFFDASYYLAKNPDVASAGMDPLSHYLAFGAQEGRAASATFDTVKYLDRNPDVKAAGVDALVHFLQFGRFEGRNDPDVNEAPNGLSLDNLSFFENTPGAVVGKITVQDPDVAQGHTFTVSDERFEVIDQMLRLKPGIFADFEDTSSTVSLTVTVTDAAGLSYEQVFELQVLDLNEAPMGITLESNTIEENTPGAIVGKVMVQDREAGDTHTFTLSDGRFEVVDNTLRLKEGVVLDFEEASSLVVEVEATDPGGLSYKTAFVLEVLDRNDAPTAVFLESNTIMENMPGAVIGLLRVQDQDANDTHQFTLSDDRFEVVDQMLRLKPDVALNFEIDPRVLVSITATDAAGVSHTQEIEVMVQNQNEAPFALILEKAEVAENVPGAVISNIIVGDPDGGSDQWTFVVSDDRLEVVDFALRLKEGVSLNFEAEPFLDITVDVTDAGGLTYSENMQIQVLDRNDAAQFITTTPDVVLTEGSASVQSGFMELVDEDAIHAYTLSFEASPNNTTTFGSFAAVLNAAGTAVEWRYTPDVALLESLGEGEEVREIYTVSVMDGDVAITQNVNVVLKGVNDDATLTNAVLTGNVQEDSVSTAQGVFQISDADRGQNVLSAASLAGIQDVYGRLTFAPVADSGEISWTYTLDNALVQSMRASEMDVRTLNFTTVDGTSHAIQVEIMGANDMASITGDNEILVDTTFKASGALSVVDIDTGESQFLADVQQLPFGTFSIDAQGAWSYDGSTSAVVQALTAEQTQTYETFVSSVDGTSYLMSFTVTGVDDAAVISGTTAGSVQEDSLLTTTGLLSVVDPDADQASFQAKDMQGLYGTFSIKASGEWIYTLDNTSSVVQALNADQSVLDRFEVSSVDGTTQMIDINVAGSSEQILLNDFSTLDNIVFLGGSMETNAEGFNTDSALGIKNFGSSSSEADISAFLNVNKIPTPDGFIPTIGSAASFMVTVEAGDRLEFDFRFKSTDGGPFNDFSFVTLSNQNVMSSFLLKDTNNSPDRDAWSHYTIDVQESGTYKLGFGTFDVGDNSVNPSLYIDNLFLS